MNAPLFTAQKGVFGKKRALWFWRAIYKESGFYLYFCDEILSESFPTSTGQGEGQRLWK